MNYTATETRLIYIPVLERIQNHLKNHRFLLSEEFQQFIEEAKQKNGLKQERENEICSIDLP